MVTAMSSTSLLTTDYVRNFANDFGFFCEQVGKPRTAFQLEALRLEARHTVIVAPRQCGKSESLSLRALWGAFREPNQLVIVVSASEMAAKRLLATIRDFCQHPLLKSSIVDETMERLVLSNGSRILSMPASEKSIRGWSVDLLIVDETAFIPDDILLSAALPTTTARPNAKVILASTPWGDAGAFFNMAMAGMSGDDPHTRTFRWRLLDAPWIHAAVVEAARNSLPPLRFRAEYEGEFITSGDAYFDRQQLLACAADYPMIREGHGMPAKCGLDWGRQQDAHAIVLAGALMDYGVNGVPIVIAPWVETSRRPYGLQVAEVEHLAKVWDLDIRTETNGVGAYPSEELTRRLAGWTRVVPQGTSLRTKEDFYGRLQVLFATNGIVIPKHEELLRQLGGITATPTPQGGLRIQARQESLHDDLPDALALAVGHLPSEIEPSPVTEIPEDTQWAETPGGIRIPLPVRTRLAEPDWGRVYLGSSATSGEAEAPNPWLAVYAEQDHQEATLRHLRELSD
jgi:hypothetical protein